MKKIISIILAFSIINFNAYALESLIPIGKTAGIKILCDGILISSVTAIDTKDGPRYPSKDAGLLAGDIIKSINNKKVVTNEELANEVLEIENKTVIIEYLRDNKLYTTEITPALDKNDGIHKIGIWIKDSLAGIGTITYIDPETGAFGALGHSVSEAESGEIMPIKQGELISSDVVDIKKGVSGTPGELHGKLNLDDEIGTIFQNENSGIYGFISDDYKPAENALEIAEYSEIVKGEATILSNIEGENIKEYAITIQDINPDESDIKNFVIQITDEELLEKTGGIVQGMSGSPILQNGKIIGAVTHVFVNDPSKGYGIYINNMLDDAEGRDS